MIHVIALAECLPQQHAVAIALLRELATLSRMEEGCERFDVYADADHPNRFNTIEVWASEAALRHHLDSAYLARIVGELLPLLAGLPQFRVLTPVSELDD